MSTCNKLKCIESATIIQHFKTQIFMFLLFSNHLCTGSLLYRGNIKEYFTLNVYDLKIGTFKMKCKGVGQVHKSILVFVGQTQRCLITRVCVKLSCICLHRVNSIFKQNIINPPVPTPTLYWQFLIKVQILFQRLI